MRSWTLALAIAVSACASSSSSPNPANPSSDGSAPTPSTEAVLGTDDVVEIRVFREPDFDGMYRVGSEGTIDFPLIGAVKLIDKSPTQVAVDIRTRLNDGYLKDAQVTVFVREQNSRKVHVFGQVNKPGTFPFEMGMSVVQAITNAGGFTTLASTNGVSVTRVVDNREKRFKVAVKDIGAGEAPNFELQPGDIIYVPEAIF